VLNTSQFVVRRIIELLIYQPLSEAAEARALPTLLYESRCHNEA